MDEGFGVADVVGGDSLDAEVVGGCLSAGVELEAGHGHGLAVRGEDLFAWCELVGAFELLIGDRPERVIFGGGDDLAVDDQIGDGVIMHPGVGDCLCFLLTGLGIGRNNLVASLDVGDGLFGAVGHQDDGVTGERARASSCRC